MATSTQAGHTFQVAENEEEKTYSITTYIGFLAIGEKYPNLASGIGALAMIWNVINVILAVFVIVPMLFVKNTISKVTRLDKDFDKNNPGYWNPFDNIIFNGIILLLGPVAIVLLAICYQWIRTKWNVVKTAIVYVFMIGAIGLEGFRIAYLVNDILYHTDVWDQGTYIIAYIFCSAEVLFALIFLFGVKNIIFRERAASGMRHAAEKPGQHEV